MDDHDSASVEDDSRGLHVDTGFLAGLEADLKVIQADVFSADMKTVLTQWETACDCGSEDGSVSDDEDYSYCYHTDFHDQRTYIVLEALLPGMQATLQKYVELVASVSKRAAVSRQNYETKIDRLAAWASIDAESLSDGSSSSEHDAPDHDEDVAMNDGDIDVPRNRPFHFTDLPTEILGDIILLAEREDYRIPLTFSHVDTQCRSRALTMPIIWTVINILHRPNTIALYISRSLGAPLEVRMSDLTHLLSTPEGRSARLRQFIDSLAPHYDRIRKLDIKFTDPAWAKIAANFVLTSYLPSLEVIDVGVIGHFRSDFVTPDENAATRTCAIKDLCLRSTQFSSFIRFLSTDLTTLHLYGDIQATVPELVQMLRRTSSLSKLTFEDLWTLDPHVGMEIGSPDTAHLPFLFEMKFIFMPYPAVLRLRVLVVAPQLRYLKITYQPSEADFNEEEEESLTLKPNAALRRLDVEMGLLELDTAGWREVFAKYPSLTHFRIARSAVTPDQLAALRDDPTLCPNLETLDVIDELKMELSFILDVVRARRSNRGGGIKWVTLKGLDWSKIRREDVVELENLLQSLKIEVFERLLPGPSEEFGSSDEEGWGSGSDEEMEEEDDGQLWHYP